MKLFSLGLTLLTLASAAWANEYDSRVAEKYRYDRESAAQSMLNNFGQWSAADRDRIVAYLARNGGDPRSVSCEATTNFDCKGSLCTPWGRTTVALLDLGAPGISFKSCDFKLAGGRACRVEDARCVVGMLPEEKADCFKASLQVSCIDEARRTTGEYIYRSAPAARGRHRSR